MKRKQKIDKEIDQKLYEQIYQIGAQDEIKKIKKMVENIEYNSQDENGAEEVVTFIIKKLQCKLK